MMKFAPFTGLALATLLAACGGQDEAPEAEAPAAEESAPASQAEAPASDAELTAPEVATVDYLRGACRATLAAVYGQNVDSIRVEGLEGTTVNLSWPAPVDGGRSTAQCRIEGDVVTWRPTGLPDPDQMRWMNQSGDPIATYAVDGPRVTVTVLSPEGATTTAQALVASEEGAR